MSHNSFGLNLEELFEGLRHLPPELQQEGGQIVFANADAAADEIQAAYPSRLGDLKRKLKVTKTAGQFSTTAVVTDTSKHANVFENGSEARHYVTRNGVKHLTGAMPAANVFVPRIERRRQTMHEAHKALLTRQGLEVSGDA